MNLSDPNFANITLYFPYGSSENFKRLMIFLGVKLCGIRVENFGVSEIPPYGIYHPRAIGDG